MQPYLFISRLQRHNGHVFLLLFSVASADHVFLMLLPLHWCKMQRLLYTVFFFLLGVYNNVITVTPKCFNDGKKLILQFCANLGGPSEDCVQWLGSSSATQTIHTVNRPRNQDRLFFCDGPTKWKRFKCAKWKLSLHDFKNKKVKTILSFFLF